MLSWNMRLRLTWLCMVWQFCNLSVHAQATQSLAIGAILEEGDQTREVAFLEGIDAANQLISENPQKFPDHLVPRVEIVKRGDSFQATRKACELLKQGVIALFGPSEPVVANHILSISRHMNIPYLQTDWTYWQTQDNFSINLHPHNKRFSEAVQEYIRQLQWNSLAFIYSNEESLLKFESILHEYSNKLLVRRWRMHEQSHEYVMKFLMKTQHRKFLVDIPYWQVHGFLKTATLYNMTSEYYAYVFTDWNVQLLDTSVYKVNKAANISMFSILDNDFYERYKNSNLIQKVQEAEKKARNVTIRKMLPAEAAFLYDSILLFTKGLIQLSPTRKIQPSLKISCDGNQYWAFGKGLINAINTIPYGNVKGATGALSLVGGIREDFNLTILEDHRSGLETFGYWTRKDKLVITKSFTQTKQERKSRLTNTVMRVSAVKSDPFVIYTGDLSEPPSRWSNDPKDWDGFCIELLKEMAKDIGFNFTVSQAPDKAYGSLVNADEVKAGAPEIWNGVIHELMVGRADLAVAALTITYERERVVDFTTPFMSLGLSILYKRPVSKKPSLFSFLKPLSPPVWGYVLAAYIVVSFVLYVVARFSPYEWLNPHPCDDNPDTLENQFTMLNSLWFTIGSLMQQGCELAPRATSTRIMAGIWWFFTLIIISSYTANLAAFLTAERMQAPISNAEDLSRQTRIKYGTLKSGSTYDFFRKSDIETYKRMWQYMDGNRKMAFVDSTESGVERVKSDDYAFILESTMNEFYAQRNCSLMQVGGLLDSKNYGIGLPQGSPHRDTLSESILKLQKEQVLEKLKRKWWREYNINQTCDGNDETSKDASALGVEQVGGVFVMLFMGVGLSAFVSIIEFLFKARKNDGNPQKSLCWEMLSEMKFAVKCMSSSKRPINRGGSQKETPKEPPTTSVKDKSLEFRPMSHSDSRQLMNSSSTHPTTYGNSGEMMQDDAPISPMFAVNAAYGSNNGPPPPSYADFRSIALHDGPMSPLPVMNAGMEHRGTTPNVSGAEYAGAPGMVWTTTPSQESTHRRRNVSGKTPPTPKRTMMQQQQQQQQMHYPNSDYRFKRVPC